MFAPPALWYQQLFWNTLLGRLLLGQLLLHKDIDQILVNDPISPGDDSLARVAAAGHAVLLPDVPRLERRIAGKQQSDGQVVLLGRTATARRLQALLERHQERVVSGIGAGSRRRAQLLISEGLFSFFALTGSPL